MDARIDRPGFLRDRSGSIAVEYALLLSMLMMVVVAMFAMGGQVQTLFVYFVTKVLAALTV